VKRKRRRKPKAAVKGIEEAAAAELKAAEATPDAATDLPRAKEAA
jgi:hypothetical protein